MMILAGDIGGTHTRLALFEKGAIVGQEVKYESRNFDSLEEIIDLFLKEKKKKIAKACFGVAGPVRDGKCKTTNLHWVVDAAKISGELKVPVHLLNDLEANAYGLEMLKKDELLLLQPGISQVGNQALISAGTGLGEAGIFWDGKRHNPFACEGGHTDFAAQNELEFELFLFLQRKFGHVSYERVISGPGLKNIYDFLVEVKGHKPSSPVLEEMKRRDPILVISEWGRLDKDATCAQAVDWFLSLYGAESGNLALKIFSLNGFYIGGGIAPHLIDKIKSGRFLESFLDKGRFRSLLASIPIWIVLNDNAALLGAANYAENR